MILPHLPLTYCIPILKDQSSFYEILGLTICILEISAHFSLHPALCNTLNFIRTKILLTILDWKIQSCLFWLKICLLDILRVLIPNPDLDFWNSDPKIYFWENLCQKGQSCSFCLIGIHSISRILIIISTLVFWISNPKAIFGQILAEKVRAFYFAWKLAHIVPRGCWFLFPH